MSHKNTNTTTYHYDPEALSIYKGQLGPMQNVLTSYMTDPLKAGFFNQQYQLAQKQGSQQSLQGIQNLLQGLQSRGWSGTMSPFMQSQLTQGGRGSSATNFGSFSNALTQLIGQRNLATGTAESFQPLMTGGTTTQKTSGLGTWLPQVLGMGIGAVTSHFGGGGGRAAADGGSSPMFSGLAGVNSMMSSPTGNFMKNLPATNYLNNSSYLPPLGAF